ncbi:MAG: hypothetical protein P1U81_19885 [Verrucomicrobiales bacterium]|nr:hypothetical protein [Verrucomicrobiales bacterium]
MKKFHPITLFVTLVLFAGTSFLQGDEIKLKNGESLQGRITYEADDIVKIELTISSSIKETKIIPRGDIAQIIKEAPDNVAFKKIEEMVPVGSLTNASTYETLIETGPASFLRTFPDSIHADKVKEIKAQLDEELDKVERGFIKLEGDWLSPQEQAEFETLVKSRIQFLRMDAVAKSGNYNGFISAMREFQAIEDNYYGTPAFPRGLELALQVLPALGRQLQGMLRDVEYRNAEFERNKAALDEIARGQIEAARKREDDNYQAGLAADKKAGIKWVRLNSRSKASIENYLKLAGGELNRIREYDPEQLKIQADKLVEVDELIAKGNYDFARTKLEEARAIVGTKGTSGSSSPKGGGGKSSYIASLSSKLGARVAEKNAKEKAREEAAKSEALAANLKKKTQKESKPEEESPEEGEAVEADSETAAKEAADQKSPDDMFAALSGADPAVGKVNEASKAGGKSKEKPKDKNEEREERPIPVAVDEGGGISFSLIIPIVTVLLLVTVVLLKYFGIGVKKGDEEEESSGEEP